MHKASRKNRSVYFPGFHPLLLYGGKSNLDIFGWTIPLISNPIWLLKHLSCWIFIGKQDKMIFNVILIVLCMQWMCNSYKLDSGSWLEEDRSWTQARFIPHLWECLHLLTANDKESLTTQTRPYKENI